MKRLPIRLRIALLSTAVSGTVLVAFGIFSLYLVYQERIAAVDREIRSLSARHPGWFAGRGNYERLSSVLAYTFGEQREAQVALAIANASGAIIYKSPHWPVAFPTFENLHILATNSLVQPGASTNPEMPMRGGGFGRGTGRGMGPPEPALQSPPRFITRRAAAATWRFGVFKTADNTLVFGMDLRAIRHEIQPLRNAFLITFPAALLIISLGGWVISGQLLRPIQTIAETAERVTARGLEQRIPRSTEAPELTRLIDVLNRMMDRLQASFHQAIRFSADASHELKTPLTIMQGELEIAVQNAASGSAEQQRASRLLEQTERLKNTTKTLLLLSQADAGQIKLSRETLDLSGMIGQMVEDTRALTADAVIDFDVAIRANISIHADRSLMETALFNLFTNAVKFNEPAGKIKITLATEADMAVLEVGNSGSGISAADQSRIFDRFFRGERSKGQEGAGLGLSLAREIIRAHGGDVTLTESRPGWTSFVVRLRSESVQAASPAA